MFGKAMIPIRPDASKMSVRISLLLLISLLIVLGLDNNFIQDDAFISFRYAKNFVDGHGLTWNPADAYPVEGYTNFLWVLFLAVGEYFNLESVSWSMFLSILFAIGTLLSTFYLALLISNRTTVAFIATILLGTNYTYSCYMTGGLETQLQVFLLTTAVYLSAQVGKNERWRKSAFWFVLSMTMTAAVLTRLDSLLVLSILGAYLYWSLLRSDDIHSPVSYLFVRFLVASIIVGTWMVFKLWYYGDIFPNTFYAKAYTSSIGVLKNGLLYVGSFFIQYGYVVVGAAYLVFYRHFRVRIYTPLLIIIVAVWLVYVVKVGGDFVEYRMLVPVLPFLAILMALAIDSVRHFAAKIALVMLLCATSYHHAKSFLGYNGIDFIYALNAQIVNEDVDWPGIGSALGKCFSASNPPVTIATTAAGAIPYYSGLRTIDLLGLNDPWISRNGVDIGDRAGHTKFATLDYLLTSDVNIVIGHPRLKQARDKSTQSLNDFFWISINESDLPEHVQILRIPVKHDYVIDVLYLVRHAAIDELIASNALLSFPTHTVNQ